MSTIVITGARGYIGTALTERLAAEGHSLRLVSRSPTAASIATPRNARIDRFVADLRDPQAWSRLLSGADAVVHLSSRTDLRAAEIDPQGDEDFNVVQVRALVEAATESPAVFFASTVTIVGAQPQSPVDDAAPDRPCSVYDRHKLACEIILREATRRGSIRACNLRLSNVYGYGGASINANRGVLNAMLRRAISGEALTLYGEGKYVRDFTHLDDVVDAFCLAAAEARVCNGGHYVIATGSGHTLAEAYEIITDSALEYTGRRCDICRVPEPAGMHPIERRNFVGNSRLFHELTGWRPRFDLKTGVRDYFARAVSGSAQSVKVAGNNA
jgi:nucleoside-diphosphate-sugar epimerase